MADFRRGRSPVTKSYPRVARINEGLRHAIATEIERIADADERLSLLTVTGVECDPDLRRARVYFDSLSDEARDALDEERSRIQGAIARGVRTKRTPHLVFEVDPAIVAGRSVEDALRSLRGDGGE